MRIIVNADDFGFSADANRGTIQCFERGGLTSATIMANMPGTGEALSWAAAHPQFSFGAHLTFSSDGLERPVLDPAALPGLVDGDGRFLGPVAVRRRAMLNRLPGEQIEREMAAQLQRIADAGVPLAHVDAHGHLHKFAPIRRALAIVLPRFGITRVRNVQDVYLRKPLSSPVFWAGPLWRRRLMAAFRTTDHFYMPTTAGDRDWPRPLLARGLDGTLEVGVHPGCDEPWRSGECDAAVEFAGLARSAGHELIGWSAL